jgi:lipoate---protein ligase
VTPAKSDAMQILNLTLPTPCENLACDEALLDWCEENCGTGFQPVSDNQGILRFWESPETFVVAGYANKIATEVNVENCRAKQIPILRRCSGGGTVLQGAGCLNYALVLRIAENSPTAIISSANKFIMERNREAIESKVQSPKSKVEVRGHTDLALITHHSSLIASRKFSGNSQRRRKNYLLFHGTFLLNFDLALVSEFLRMPPKQPDYRNNRDHDKFLTNLNLSSDKVKAALAKIWNANEKLSNPPLQQISKLAREKYSKREWNFKF